MDPRTHTVIQGENLARERDLEHAWANQPCKVSPHQFTNVLIVLVLSGAIFAALWAADRSTGAPV